MSLICIKSVLLSNSKRLIKNFNVCYLNTSPILHTFWERDEKGGYQTTTKKPSIKEQIRVGIKELKHEIGLWSEEVREHFEDDPIYAYRPGEIDIVWDFKKDDCLNQWIVTSDSDHGEGYSRCDLTITNNRNGLFSGELSTRVPKDGRIKRAGYCNMKTVRARKSFKRDGYLEWSPYNMLVMKVRGDGRSYMLNVATKGYYDILWNDMYQFVLYTRGGPYWQISKIPFSKFFLTSKGRIQDKQYPIALNRVTSFGISAGDKINGPFSLEIAFIGLEYDPNHTEEFAYEMYRTPKYMAAT